MPPKRKRQRRNESCYAGRQPRITRAEAEQGANRPRKPSHNYEEEHPGKPDK